MHGTVKKVTSLLKLRAKGEDLRDLESTVWLLSACLAPGGSGLDDLGAPPPDILHSLSVVEWFV